MSIFLSKYSGNYREATSSFLDFPDLKNLSDAKTRAPPRMLIFFWKNNDDK